MRNRLQRRGADPGRVNIPRCLAESAESVKTPAPQSDALLPINGERQAGRQADWAAEISRIKQRLARLKVFLVENTPRLYGEEWEMVRPGLQATAEHLAKNSAWPETPRLEPVRLGSGKLS